MTVKILAARLELRNNFFSFRVCEKWNITYQVILKVAKLREALSLLQETRGLLLHCKKKVIDFPVPSRDVTYHTLPDREK